MIWLVLFFWQEIVILIVHSLVILFILTLVLGNVLFPLWLVLRALGVPIGIRDRVETWLYERQVKKHVVMSEARVDVLYATTLDDIAGELGQR